MASETAVAGQRRSHTSPFPGAKRFYLPGTRERPEQPRVRIAFSKGARPLKHRQADPNVRLYNLPAPAALPPPDDVNPRERKSRLPLSPNGLCPWRFALGAYATSLPKSGSRRGTWEMEAAFRGRGPSGAGRSDVSCRFS